MIAPTLNIVFEDSRDVFYRVLKQLALRARGFKPDKTLSLVY